MNKTLKSSCNALVLKVPRLLTSQQFCKQTPKKCFVEKFCSGFGISWNVLTRVPFISCLLSSFILFLFVSIKSSPLYNYLQPFDLQQVQFSLFLSYTRLLQCLPQQVQHQ
uniref:Transmembrane protein n=1 Tax=Cacopsylla melanoneura TaxID=428564 RepID=A0A8D9A403_9HEMI